MTSETPDADDPYQAFLSRGGFHDVWKTKERNIFAIAENGIYIESGVGPLEEKEIEFNRVDGYEVTVEKEQKTIKPLFPLGIGVALILLAWVFNIQFQVFNVALGTVLTGLALLWFIASALVYIQARSNVQENTTITLYMGRFETEVIVPGDIASSIHQYLGANVDRGEPDVTEVEPEETRIQTQV